LGRKSRHWSDLENVLVNLFSLEMVMRSITKSQTVHCLKKRNLAFVKKMASKRDIGKKHNF
jgi:hypothetical protein